MKLLIVIFLPIFLLSNEISSIIKLDSEKTNLEKFNTIKSEINRFQSEVSKLDSNLVIKNNLRLKRGFESFVFPGLGQYKLGKKKIALLFASLELILIGASIHYRSKGDKLKSINQSYGLKHWDFFRWIRDYYNWENDYDSRADTSDEHQSND